MSYSFDNFLTESMTFIQALNSSVSSPHLIGCELTTVLEEDPAFDVSLHV